MPLFEPSAPKMRDKICVGYFSEFGPAKPIKSGILTNQPFTITAESGGTDVKGNMFYSPQYFLPTFDPSSLLAYQEGTVEVKDGEDDEGNPRTKQQNIGWIINCYNQHFSWLSPLTPEAVQKTTPISFLAAMVGGGAKAFKAAIDEIQAELPMGENGPEPADITTYLRRYVGTSIGYKLTQKQEKQTDGTYKNTKYFELNTRRWNKETRKRLPESPFFIPTAKQLAYFVGKKDDEQFSKWTEICFESDQAYVGAVDAPAF